MGKLNVHICVEEGFFFLTAMLLLMLPLRWVLACFAAAAVHELGHFAAVLLCGGRITGLMLSVHGARMDASPLPPRIELWCVLAGPAASFLLVLLGRWFPLVALCGLIQGIYNLLPVGTLDGATALRCLRSGKIQRGCNPVSRRLVTGHTRRSSIKKVE